MWKKITLLMIVFLSLVGTVAAICGDHVQPLQNCTMVTPSIVCTDYTYDILSTSGQIVTTGNLTLLNQTIYTFTFNQSQGDFIVRLCDNSTQIITVGENDFMGAQTSLMAFSLLLAIVPLLVHIIMRQRLKDDELMTTDSALENIRRKRARHKEWMWCRTMAVLAYFGGLASCYTALLVAQNISTDAYDFMSAIVAGFVILGSVSIFIVIWEFIKDLFEVQLASKQLREAKRRGYE